MRPARVAACAATTALLITTTGAGTAAAATTDQELLHRATTATGVVQVVLDLPTALPGVPDPAVLTLLGTQGQSFHGAGGSGDTTVARSFLAGGDLVTDSPLSALLAPLDRTVSSDLTDPGQHTASVVSVPANPLGLALDVGSQQAAVTVGSRLATSSGSLVQADLGSLRTLGLGTALDAALTPLNDAVASLATQASALTAALSTLPALPSTTVPNPLSGIITGSPATLATPALSGAALADLVNALPAQVQAITTALTDGAVIRLTAVDTAQRIAPAASSVAASSRAKAADVALLGGLVTVHATEATAGATAGLTRAAASSTASATLLDVEVSTDLTTLLQVVASDKGITAGLLDGTLLDSTLDVLLQPLVQQLDATLNTVLAELTDLLSSLNGGAQVIAQGTVSKVVSADGRRAEAHAVPAAVTVGLPVAPNVLTVSLGQADATAEVSLSAPPAAAPTPAPELPHTGAGELLPLLALVLVAVAAAARRRATR